MAVLSRYAWPADARTTTGPAREVEWAAYANPGRCSERSFANPGRPGQPQI